MADAIRLQRDTDLDWLLGHMQVLVEMGTELATADGEKPPAAIADHCQVVFDQLREEIHKARDLLRTKNVSKAS